jgi:hypothetical protein
LAGDARQGFGVTTVNTPRKKGEERAKISLENTRTLFFSPTLLVHCRQG